MITEKVALPLHVIVNRYLIFTNELFNAGWHVYGEQRVIFAASPQHYQHGAVKFFEKEGVLHSICVGLQIDESNEGEAIVYAREYNLGGSDLEWDAFEKVLSVDIATLDYDEHSKELINKYQETVILDFHDDDNQFLGFKSGNRAIFLTPESKLITKSISLSKHTALSVSEAVIQNKMDDSRKHFNVENYIVSMN